MGVAEDADGDYVRVSDLGVRIHAGIDHAAGMETFTTYCEYCCTIDHRCPVANARIRELEAALPSMTRCDICGLGFLSTYKTCPHCFCRAITTPKPGDGHGT